MQLVSTHRLATLLALTINDNRIPQMQPSFNDWTAVIPIRSGSKGLANKNTKVLAGRPLYQHSVDQALEAGASQVIITTDIAQVLAADHHHRVTLLERPSALCTDATPMYPVVKHALSALEIQGVFVLLQATSPLRGCGRITEALKQYATGSHDLVFSVVAAESSVLKWGVLDGTRFKPLSDIRYCFSNRQSLPAVVRPNGAVYVADTRWFINNESFETDKIGVVTMSPEESIDIDTQDSFEDCESILSTTWSSAA